MEGGAEGEAMKCESFDDRVKATARLLLETAQENDMHVTLDNRITVSDAADILGYERRSLLNAIREGRGPRAYSIGLKSSRKTLRIWDIAHWMELNSD